MKKSFLSLPPFAYQGYSEGILNAGLISHHSVERENGKAPLQGRAAGPKSGGYSAVYFFPGAVNSCNQDNTLLQRQGCNSQALKAENHFSFRKKQEYPCHVKTIRFFALISHAF